MASGYTRQSSAEIVTGQVIEASDFNNEFNQLLAAFNATTGHDHSGGTGLGPPISLTLTATGVTGVLHAKFGGVHTAAANPAVTDDTPDYAVGSIWVNTSTGVAFLCTSNTLNNAVWRPLPTGIIGVSTSDPTVNDDTDDGYRVGSLWVNTSSNQVFVAVSVTAGAASWLNITFDFGQAILAAGAFN